MQRVRMYTTGMCPYCVMAKRLLQKKGVAIEEVRVDTSGEQRAEMMRITGRRTVPQIFVGETHVGGYDELAAMEHAGTLDPLLNS
ncbi:MAG TPA: glutaredoxin 3 [Stenotrophobium sp.]|nr:glutaredoxin 3 [Stenotrophobium sp.]